MVTLLTNFNRDDCVYHQVVEARGCCGRKFQAGVCTITDPDGIKRHKTCSMKMLYCKYEQKEALSCPN